MLGIVDVREIGGAAIGSDVGFGQFETHLARIIVAIIGIVDRYRGTVDRGELARHGFAQIGGESRYAALAWQVVADKCDAVQCGLVVF